MYFLIRVIEPSTIKNTFELLTPMVSNNNVILNRIKVYKNQTEILKEYYKKQNKYFKVDGSKSITDVKYEIFNLIEKNTNN